MTQYIIVWLEEKGYSNVFMTKETAHYIFFEGNDSRGLFLEFKYDKRDGYILDREIGSKYWDILDKVEPLK
jgi:hypothetical protein